MGRFLTAHFYMNKQHLIEHIRFALEAKLQDATLSAQMARDDATHEQSAAETQYDSLSIEAAYLAHGQSERADQAHKSIQDFEDVFKLHTFESVQVGALVCIEDENTQEKWFYIGPSEGGLKINIKGEDVFVVTLHSPIGQLMANKKVDDEFTWDINGQSHEMIITKII